jgi:hypothetical protein
MLQGRFRPSHPDDLQVLVHDGGPPLTRNEPEVVWVTVTGMDGDVFRGRVLNQPENLRSVRRGDEIRFVVPDADAPAALRKLADARLGLPGPAPRGWILPVLVTDKYLRERGEWVIHPCPGCGLSELLDAPSDLIRVIFPDASPDAPVRRFNATCPNCGGVQRVESRAEAGAAPAGVAEDRDDPVLETARRWVESMTAIGTLLAAITDDAAADAALPELEEAIARHEDVSRQVESYETSGEDSAGPTPESRRDYLAAHSDMAVSEAAARANAAFAQARAPNRATDIEAALKRIGLA